MSTITDHRPILLKEYEVDYGPFPFWFFHSWLDMEGFHKLAVDTWKNDGIVEPEPKYMGAILSSIKCLKQKGIDLLPLSIRKIGNGISIQFWEDIWCGDKPLKVQFPRVYLLDKDRCCNIVSRLSLPDWNNVLRRQPRGGVESCQFLALQSVIRDVVLSDKEDSWKWSLDVSVGFSVSSILLVFLVICRRSKKNGGWESG
ncbi:RNA-directed DNA polymerase, eukaryota, Reverse transcriptase zinc-binding domain protein [Artemisia annua]|uniref:RNA-directed DNA polymerase, eukaryota, Reverse transcriptase zinc-binding domain protein n=1 Tax=Artemisia annua TaxID=35608 RepID=A0A2U1NGX7_ARTAN|nr:RNA-directed DNA polymerase, eukaryota, Reverse transcriptase zinc-binding domain protein [Artemisia annua]